MDNVEFYIPPLASTSQPRPSRGYHNQQYKISRQHKLFKPADKSDPWKTNIFGEQHHEYNVVEAQNNLASPHFLNTSWYGDSDCFPTMQEFWSNTRQKSISASVESTASGMVNNLARIDSLADSSCSTMGIPQDATILSDDGSKTAKSVTYYRNPTAKAYSSSPHVADDELGGGRGFQSIIKTSSEHKADDHHDENRIISDNAIMNIELPLSPHCPKPASPQRSSATQQDNQGPDTSSKGSYREDKGAVAANSTRRQNSAAVSYINPALDGNNSEPQDSPRDHAQSPQLNLAVTPQPSNLNTELLSECSSRQDATRIIPHKRRRSTSPIKLATTVSTASITFEPTDIKDPQSRAPITYFNQKKEINVVDQEIENAESTDDSNDEDYADNINTIGSGVRGRSRPQKRIKRAIRTEEGPFTCSKDTPCQEMSSTGPGNVQESEEIPIHGFFTLKTVQSKLVYHLTFSQEMLLPPQERGQRQDISTDLEDAPPNFPSTDSDPIWGISKITGRKIVDGEKMYKLRWDDTWMSESELAGAKQLIDEFEAKLRHRHSESGDRRQRRSKAADHFNTGLPDGRCETKLKKPRGRPRKQT